MKTLLLTLTLLLLTACDENASGAVWRNAPHTHFCTVEQYERVEVQTLFCNENSGKINSYCYGSALVRNCSNIVIDNN